MHSLIFECQTTHHFIHEQVLTGGEASQYFTGEAPTPVFKLKIRRTHLLEDTFRQLAAADHENFQKELHVSKFYFWIILLLFLETTRSDRFT